MARRAVAAASIVYRISMGSEQNSEILADQSIDAVCISTPDHRYAYIAVEACKAGKDIYVEKPACTYVDEGRKMVEAARKRYHQAR